MDQGGLQCSVTAHSHYLDTLRRDGDRSRGQGAQVDGRGRRRASGRCQDGGRLGRSGQGGPRSSSSAKLPANYAVPPHHHPGDEVVRVIDSGTLNYGMGDKLDRANAGGLTRAIT